MGFFIDLGKPILALKNCRVTFSRPGIEKNIYISVPCGKAYDLPVGFSFFSCTYKEGEIISISYDYEQVSKHRVMPAFKKEFLV